jgi:hypothetical protein
MFPFIRCVVRAALNHHRGFVYPADTGMAGASFRLPVIQIAVAPHTFIPQRFNNSFHLNLLSAVGL